MTGNDWGKGSSGIHNFNWNLNNKDSFTCLESFSWKSGTLLKYYSFILTETFGRANLILSFLWNKCLSSLFLSVSAWKMGWGFRVACRKFMFFLQQRKKILLTSVLNEWILDGKRTLSVRNKLQSLEGVDSKERKNILFLSKLTKLLAPLVCQRG